MLKYLMKSAVRSVIWAAEASYNNPAGKGARGERVVHAALTSVLNKEDYRVYSDLIVPVAGGTTQLDHLVLSRFGIFVIETKNMSGWIFGGADQKKWTQVHKGGKRRSFQNPLRQNYAHVRAVQEILGVDFKILHNFVVFTGTAEPKTHMPENVAWGLQALGKLIGVRKRLVLSEVEVINFAQRLESKAGENDGNVRNEHIRSLQEKAASETRAPSSIPADLEGQASCPKCRGEMVKRVNRKTGDAFWGCSKFPKCRGTRTMSRS
ncbi:MAG: NERD domain-containing protein [Pseudomonadota bacterium]